VTRSKFHVVKDWLDPSDRDVLTAQFQDVLDKWSLSRDVKAGEVLRSSYFSQSYTMNKGAVVTLVSGQGSFRVRTLGKVKEVLDEGASVVVENIDSKKEVVGRAVGNDEVEVIY
jgi:flagella basal body P-ring formation protein FlgA